DGDAAMGISVRRPVRAGLASLGVLLALLGWGTSAPALSWTWNNPITGLWSDPLGTNWTPAGAPTSSATTSLTFNATAVQAYVAPNVLGAFSLNSLILNNTGTGTIGLAGNDLMFTGVAPTLTIAGSGSTTIANNVIFSTTSSTLASAVTTINGSGT